MCIVVWNARSSSPLKREMETPSKTKGRGVGYISATLAVSACGLQIWLAVFELATAQVLRAQGQNAETTTVIRINPSSSPNRRNQA